MRGDSLETACEPEGRPERQGKKPLRKALKRCLETELGVENAPLTRPPVVLAGLAPRKPESRRSLGSVYFVEGEH